VKPSSTSIDPTRSVFIDEKRVTTNGAAGGETLPPLFQNPIHKTLKPVDIVVLDSLASHGHCHSPTSSGPPIKRQAAVDLRDQDP
jgi:hypothetical protein